MIAHCNAPWTPHFASFFARRGHHLLLMSFAPPVLDGVEGIRIEHLGKKPFDPDADKHLFVTRVPRVRRLLKSFQAEVVFAPYLRSNGLTAVLASRVPVLVAAVGTDVLNPGARRGTRRRVLEAVLRMICRRATVINAVSPAIQAELVRIGADPDKILLMPFGVDLERFPPPSGPPRPTARRLLSTRKHEPLYDIPTIINALAMLKAAGHDFHCTFTAEGSRWEANRKQAEEAGLTQSVTFTGQLPYAKLPEILAESDVYISASFSDGTSVSLLEAIATGIFPVVSRIPANEPWIDDGRTGLLFEPGRADQLAAALETALQRSDLRESARTANRAKVEREANMERNMERLEAVLENLARGRPNA